MGLTLAEKETLIRFDDSSDTAEVYTCNGAWIRKLDKLCLESQTITIKKEDKYSKTYNFPKKWLRVRKPKELSMEERRKMEVRGKLLSEKSKEARKAKEREKENVF